MLRSLTGIIVAAFVAVAIASCASDDLTPRQAAFDLLTKFETAQVVVEEVVVNEDIPVEVRRAIRDAEQTARAAVLQYSATIRNTGRAPPAIFEAMSSAVRELIDILAVRGFVDLRTGVD